VDVGPTNHEPKATALCVSERGEEAGEQTLDLMNKNRVTRHEVRGKLASDSDAQKGPKRLDVNAAGLGGKLSHLIRGGLAFIFEARSQQKP